MSLYDFDNPRTPEQRLLIKRRSIQGRLNRGGLDPVEKSRAEVRLREVTAQLKLQQGRLLPDQESSSPQVPS